jgi:hypothetical protein
VVFADDIGRRRWRVGVKARIDAHGPGCDVVPVCHPAIGGGTGAVEGRVLNSEGNRPVGRGWDGMRCWRIRRPAQARREVRLRHCRGTSGRERWETRRGTEEPGTRLAWHDRARPLGTAILRMADDIRAPYAEATSRYS